AMPEVGIASDHVGRAHAGYCQGCVRYWLPRGTDGATDLDDGGVGLDVFLDAVSVVTQVRTAGGEIVVGASAAFYSGR
ncbi:MAG TPA: hypothetical protein P5300_05530, partial [Acidobacteriota bacterium]|nr:hypothetical protein [Acidobacteriota bacterium]